MDEIAQIAVDMSETEMSYQVLHLLREDEDIVAMLQVGPGPNIALAARMLVYEHEPRYAVLVTEGWAVMARPDETDPDRRAVIQGRKKPSDLPLEKRDEVLVLYGESAEGEDIYRMWVIRKQDGKRVLEEQKGPAVNYDTRFKPMFLVEDMERIMEHEMADPTTMSPEIAALLRGAAGELSAEERHATVRRVIGRMLEKAKPLGVKSESKKREEWLRDRRN
jgi:hypothetical protein